MAYPVTEIILKDIIYKFLVKTKFIFNNNLSHSRKEKYCDIVRRFALFSHKSNYS